MIVFGGKEDSCVKSIVNKLMIYSFQNKQWTEPEVKGNKPVPRMGHSACIYKNFMVIHGGWSGKYVLKDTPILDLSNGFSDLKYISLDELPEGDKDSDRDAPQDEKCNIPA
jgi:hypothetical protein